MTYDEAMALLRRYNSEPFHLCHALTVSKVMRRMAQELGYGDEAEFWAIVGLLHDIDFERWPQEHCVRCVELLREGGADERLIHAVVSHGYGLCADVAPEHEMEKVLFACDELTGLIGACAKMRPSGSITDMDLKSLKKKYKSKAFAAGCSREVIAQGAQMLGWELDDLLSRTLEVMKPDEAAVAAELAALS
ncbi:MAG: HDIG domain-containing protein [Clostridiales bacterium]|nr:HDIG domain-containing protein [Clostridiales bacterium]